MPEISVIMCVYNTNEKYLREAIESILSQSFADFELIIVNDGSEPYVRDVILSYRDNRIKYYENKTNLGIVASSNLAIEKALGKYIAKMDSDDIAHTQRLQIQYEYMENHTDTGVVGAVAQFINSRENSPAPPWINLKYPHVFTSKDIENANLFDYCSMCNSSAFMRRDLFEKFGKYSPSDSYCEDFAFWLRLIGKTKIENIPKVLVYYRYHDNNATLLHKTRNEIKSEFLRLKYQKAIYNINTHGIFKIWLKRYNKRKISASELRRYIDYQMQIGAIKPRVIDRNKILSKCKDAVFNTRGILKTPLCACNRELLLLIVQKYLCNITGKKFT